MARCAACCRFDIRPEITRGEIRDLWKTFITNTDKTLDFLQFTRHFGYSLKSAAFPNAKVSSRVTSATRDRKSVV